MKMTFSGFVYWSTHASAQGVIDRLDGAGVYSTSQAANVGGVNLCLHPCSEYPVCLSEPSRAPGKLRVRSVSASEVEVTWKPLAWSNSRRRILGYEVSTSHVHIHLVLKLYKYFTNTVDNAKS